jgi:two-component system, LytTR family, sensor kinase
VICFILQDFTWGFVRIALVNSFILGLSLIGGCYLSQRLVSKVNIAYNIAISFSLVLGVGIISFFIVLFLEPTLFIYYNRGAFSFLFINFLFIITLHIISSGLIIYREIMIEKEKVIGNERYLKNQMEMQLLSSRINPHFLFNTLNTILTLLKQPAKAETAILNLSDLLRDNLEQSDKISIPVKEELENVRKYLEIQKLRFGDKLQYDIKGDADFEIPPLIIQPLVENSIKHNMQNSSRLAIEVLLSRENKRNTISVMDSVKAVHPSMLNRGQGLTITKKRVENSHGTFLIHNGGIEISFNP